MGPVTKIAYFTCAVEASLCVSALSFLSTVMEHSLLCGAFIYICTVCAVSSKTSFTRTAEAAQCVSALCYEVAVVSHSLTLINICDNKSRPSSIVTLDYLTM